jgi:hypothetical protein
MLAPALDYRRLMLGQLLLGEKTWNSNTSPSSSLPYVKGTTLSLAEEWGTFIAGPLAVLETMP